MRDYTKQPEGVKAYQDAGVPHESEISEREYETWLGQTVNEYMPELEREEEGAWEAAVKKMPYDSKENRRIRQMNRVLVGVNEFIKYGEQIVRYDILGNRQTRYRSDLGLYCIPNITYKRTVNPETGKTKKVIDYVTPEPAWSIPFTKENSDKLYKFARENEPNANENTQYYVTKGYNIGGSNPCVMVRSYKDWREGDIEELLRFGHVATPLERQIWEDEKAGKIQLPTADKKRPYT